MVALPVLACSAAAIGLSRSIQLKEDWIEPSIIWAIVAARSGAGKSPAQSKAISPLMELQEKSYRRHSVEMEEFKRLAHKKKSNLELEDEQELPKPVLTRHIVKDCTIEALAPILNDNPRGVLLSRDEASGWFRSFNQYKGGKGADEAGWLELHNGGEISVDRKTGDNRTIFVPRTRVSFCGTIQPGVLEAIMTPERYESGLVARLLLACPECFRKSWNKNSHTKKAKQNYHARIGQLVKLQPIEDSDGLKPVLLRFTNEAVSIWTKWYNNHADRQYNSADDRMAAVLAKLEGYTARFALVLMLAENPDADYVDLQAIQRAIVVTEWFIYESTRLYSRSLKGKEDQECEKLRKIIARKNGEITPSQLVQNSRDYENTSQAKDKLDSMVKAGILTAKAPKPGPRGGRPSTVYCLS